ncbi:peptidoglycan D,D-transpeptidase FtsI family protein [Ornithinibacillus halotolerans]|uniref:serine-type D-Ala-D-Ala carboxypeptidase n=1 Tax=Ornithinibacillus halotolerans TaxID=1274357 RepID=A0A916RTM3_9BACI|nr:penicillin-binding protein 2 [Ornithinibacillus halotolerans]GGA68443.1 penicillin-binding protein [Ornithinibacillus halotolerans]
MKKEKKKKAQLPFRLNILFFVVFLLFAVLILQLGVVQILKGEEFQKEIEKTTQDITKLPVPRGEIYDRNYNVIVKNKPMYAITYTPQKGVQAKERLEVAQKLSKYINMFKPNKKDKKEQIERITDREKKEYWYLLNEEEALNKLTDEEASEMKPAEQYRTILERITEQEFNSNLTEDDYEIILIKRELDRAFALTPQVVKSENVTPEEYARVAEHLALLPGINATTDWVREYPYEDTIQGLLGDVSTEKQGIPAERVDYYLAKGYNRNDRVGQEGLEFQYEDILRGRKEQVKYTMSKSGVILNSEVVVPGESGKDLILTIDMEFQQMVDEILRSELEAATRGGNNKYLRDMIAVAMDPNTGELLAVSGQSLNKDKTKIIDAPYKALHDAHIPGSTIKGATVLAGYDSGVISPGHREFDTPIKIAGSPTVSSWKNLGMVNDIDALRLSSNVYMAYIAMRMGGEYNYKPGKSVSFNRNAFYDMRYYFNQFGLGVKTGVDFPEESPGYVGSINVEGAAGLFQQFAFGQYDTYTAMQLAQYVSTIANGGYRVQPQFVKEVRNPTSEEDGLGNIYRSMNTNILNKITMDDSLLNRVQEGFRQVFQAPGGTAYSYFRDVDYSPAGKTGTAQFKFFVDGNEIDTINLTMVAYAPHDNPEIAISVIVPQLDLDETRINSDITKRIFDAYFELKEKRANNNTEQENDENEEETEEENE